MANALHRRAFFLAKILGCFPYYIDSYVVETDFKLVAYSFILRIPLLNQLVNGLMISQLNGMADISTLLNDSILIISYFYTFTIKKDIETLLRMYANANSKFLKLKVRTYFKWTLGYDYGLMIFALCIGSISVFYERRADWHAIYEEMLFQLTLWFYFMMVQPFMQVLDNLRTRIKMTRMLLGCCSNSVSVNRDKLESVIQLFQLLCATCETLNNAFSPNLLLTMFIVFWVVTTNLYGMYQLSDVFSDSLGRNTFLAIVFCVVECWLLISLCQDTSKEMEQFNDLLYDMMIGDQNHELAGISKLRLHIAMKNEVVFTACGFFSLDYPLIHSMVAAATSYLVILIDLGGLSTPFTSPTPAEV